MSQQFLIRPHIARRWWLNGIGREIWVTVLIPLFKTSREPERPVTSVRSVRDVTDRPQNGVIVVIVVIVVVVISRPLTVSNIYHFLVIVQMIENHQQYICIF